MASMLSMLSNLKDKNREFILKKCETINYSEPTSRDLENSTRRKSRLDLVMISFIVFGIEICYAAETALVSPIIQKIGIPVQYMSSVWALSPLVGFFTCPILGTWSDNCRSRLGRRRPFIIAYSCGILVGLFLTGYSHIYGRLFWHSSNDGINTLTIFLTVVGVVLLDFNCDACQSPSRAFLIDISCADDHGIGLSTFTVMAGAGGAFGYILGGIPWADFAASPSSASVTDAAQFDSQSQINISNDTMTATMTPSPSDSYLKADIAYDHKQLLFTFVAAIYLICALISVTSFKEIPLESSCRTTTTTTTNNGVSTGSAITIRASGNKYERMNDEYGDDDDDEVGNTRTESSSNININAMNSNAAANVDVAADAGVCARAATTNLSKLDILKYCLKSIVHMPSSLKWLCVTHCLCWMSLLCYSLYFTDFVGEEIYGKLKTKLFSPSCFIYSLYIFSTICIPQGGLPMPMNERNYDSIKHKLYDRGVRAGSLCMAVYSISCSFYSFFLQFLMKRFRKCFFFLLKLLNVTVFL